MRWKMAENSLFAILLRSRWWVSFTVAALVVLLSMALLPREYALFGAVGALPFAVIGGIALSRQWGALSPAQTRDWLARAQAMSWPEFSAALESAWRAGGYGVQRGQGAADFVLDKGGRTTLVSAKRWKAARQGLEPLRELDAARRAREADAAVFLALGELSDNARDFARTAPIRVLQGTDLATLLHSAR